MFLPHLHTRPWPQSDEGTGYLAAMRHGGMRIGSLTRVFLSLHSSIFVMSPLFFGFLLSHLLDVFKRPMYHSLTPEYAEAGKVQSVFWRTRISYPETARLISSYVSLAKIVFHSHHDWIRPTENHPLGLKRDSASHWWELLAFSL